MDVWIALRADNQTGSGTAMDPFHGGLVVGAPLAVSLSAPDFEAIGDSGAQPHGFIDGDIVQITGVTGEGANRWNQMFSVYDVNDDGTTFKFGVGEPQIAAPSGSPRVSRVRFLFDEVMRAVPANMKVNIGPGEFLTRGYGQVWTENAYVWALYGQEWLGGWQPKTGQKIVGAGIDVTTLKLLGAGLVNVQTSYATFMLAEPHYHAVGMPIEPAGATPIAALKHFEISDLTVDCNVDNQPIRFDLHPAAPWANVACGGVRVLGSHTRINRVKAINWGTKSLKQDCFVLSIIQASGQPSDVGGNPVVTATDFNGIEDCVAIQPSKNNARETTILHIGGVKNATNHAQGFGTAAYIRQNYVDAQDKGQPSPPTAFFLRGRVQNATQVAVHCGCWPFPRRPRRRIRRGGGRRLGERVL